MLQVYLNSGEAGTCQCLQQVFGAARQMLSLVAGGKIDEWLLGHLRGLRDEHFVARMLHALESMLWPGGVWFLHAHPSPQVAHTPHTYQTPPLLKCCHVVGPGHISDSIGLCPIYLTFPANSHN